MICFNLEQKRFLSIKTDVFGHSRLSQVKAGAQSRCIVIIPPCTYSILRYCILTPICSIETIRDPRETFLTYINLLGNFTHPTSEANWTTRGVWPTEIAIEVPDYSCLNLIRSREERPPPTHKLTHWSGGGGCNQGVGRQRGHLREKGKQTVILRSSQKTWTFCVVATLALQA